MLSLAANIYCNWQVRVKWLWMKRNRTTEGDNKWGCVTKTTMSSAVKADSCCCFDSLRPLPCRRVTSSQKSLKFSDCTAHMQSWWQQIFNVEKRHAWFCDYNFGFCWPMFKIRALPNFRENFAYTVINIFTSP